MILSTENIKKSNVIEQSEINMLSTILFENISISSKDTKHIIRDKINTLKSLKDYLTNNIDIDKLLTDESQLTYIKILSKFTEQIENFEIIIGDKDINSLKRAAKTFSRKTQFPIGIYNE